MSDEAVAVIALDHGDFVASLVQVDGNLAADRAQPDDDDVIAHPGELLTPQRLRQSPADQCIGQQGGGDSNECGASQNQDHGPQAKPSGLITEVEVTESDRGDGLGSEVHGIEWVHRRAVGFSIPGREHYDRHKSQTGEYAEGDLEWTIDCVEHRQARVSHAANEGRALQQVLATVNLQSDFVVVGGRADECDQISGLDFQVAARAHDRWRSVMRSHCDWRQVAPERPDAPGALIGDSGDDEVLAPK